jgi:hypothetical protein
MEKSAVDFLVKELNEKAIVGGTIDRLVMNNAIEQAKEMEKQQIISAGNSCAIKQHLHNEKVDKMTMDEMLEFANTQTVTIGEEYYNETFNLSQQDKP